jgi:hypothetical protein
MVSDCCRGKVRRFCCRCLMSGRLLSLILFSLLVSAFALHQLFHHLHNNFDGKFISTNYQSIDRLLDSFLVMSLNFFSNAFTPFAHSRDSRDRIEPFGGVLGVTDGGVDVYSCDYKTAPSGTEYDNYVGGVYTGYKFQCVELARRYLLINHGVVFDSVFMVSINSLLLPSFEQFRNVNQNNLSWKGVSDIQVEGGEEGQGWASV